MVKNYTISPSFRAASKAALVKSVPSDLLYTFCAALFDKSNKSGTTNQRHQFYRMTTERILKLVKNLRQLEEQYYAANK